MLVMRPLFSLERAGHEEVCVHGEVVMVNGAGIVFRSGDTFSRLPARSLLKPLQFQATGLGRADVELDLCRVPALGSISATFEQASELARWHADPSLRGHLLLPEALPLDGAHRARLGALGSGPSPLFHPCFSKHMAILAACAERGWPTRDYASPSHPFHGELLRVLDFHLDRAGSSVEFVTDGCRLPTPILSSVELARIYHHLAMAGTGSVELRLRQAMQAHPDWIGGADRFDTRLMLANPGRLIAKEGADGLLAIGTGPTRREPGGTGIVIKLAAGHMPAWAALAAVPFLEALGLNGVCDPTPGQQVVWHVGDGRAAGAPHDISPPLSEHIAVWPSDTPYRRQLMTEIGAPTALSGAAWQLTVSSIHTTLHVGAHADAPNHFTLGAPGIDAVPLDSYRGICQVIQVDKPRGSLIVSADLDGLTLTAPRLLFKTGSYPDPQRFNEDFVALSPELVTALEARGIVLIGIDTPSIDPFTSKALPTHHATREGRGVAILEGLDLSQISAGTYELVALPLRLEGADASPVRATLWPLR
jgi:arylformamidase